MNICVSLTITSPQTLRKKSNDDFQGQLFFPHRKANFCGFAIEYHGKNYFKLLNKDNYKAGFLLITEANVQNENFLLINLYRGNAESEQLTVLSNFSSMLEKINDIVNKNIVRGGEFVFLN